MENYPKYEEDFYGWVMANAQFLKAGNLSEIDLENLIEELISLGGNQYDQLVNRLAVLMAHLLKWQYQPNFRGRSWSGTLKEQRLRIKSVIKKNPSLKNKITEAVTEAYESSLAIVEKETRIDLKLLPVDCPYSFEQCLDSEFYPE